jgi:hypothetical protein
MGFRVRACAGSPATWWRCGLRCRTLESTTTPRRPSFQPSVSVPVDLDGARKVFKLVDALEDSDDVQNVYTNVEVSDEVLAALDEE